MEDKEKIIETLKKALVEENMIGLILQQLQERTKLSRENVRMALKDLQRENKIEDSYLTITPDSKSKRKIYFLKEGFEMMKKHYEKDG